MNTGAKRLRAWRGKRTLHEVSFEIGCNPSSLSLYERGKRLPERDIALKIKAATGIPVPAWDEVATDHGDSDLTASLPAVNDGGKRARPRRLTPKAGKPRRSSVPPPSRSRAATA
jgi:transcriptional regulator with XRE-family HTH domain